MRYYDDGDLTDGMKMATHPLGSEFLAGDYHVVWTFCNGKRSTLDWTSERNTDEIFLSDWDFTFRRSEGQDEGHFDVALHFGTLDLEYTLEYQDKAVNHLKLVRKNSSGDGIVDDDAILTFSDLRDEQGFPYLRCNFATNEHNLEDDIMTNIEFIAKRTDTDGQQQLGFTKNEKLRLGFPVWDDGTFEPEDSDDELNSQNPDALNKQLQRHIEAAVKIHKKMVSIQSNINTQVTNATNGMQQAMQQAWRSVSNPAPNVVLSHEQGLSNSPPTKRRKHATAGAEDPDQTPPIQRRRKAGPESTPISIEHEEARTGSGPVRRKRGSGLSFGSGGRGGKRKSVHKSKNSDVNHLASYLVDLVRPEDEPEDSG